MLKEHKKGDSKTNLELFNLVLDDLKPKSKAHQRVLKHRLSGKLTEIANFLHWWADIGPILKKLFRDNRVEFETPIIDFGNALRNAWDYEFEVSDATGNDMGRMMKNHILPSGKNIAFEKAIIYTQKRIKIKLTKDKTPVRIKIGSFLPQKNSFYEGCMIDNYVFDKDGFLEASKFTKIQNKVRDRRLITNLGMLLKMGAL